MSTLTKTLVVLLALSTIFLCGIVVTYIANADDYKQQYNDLRGEATNLRQKNKDLTEQVRDVKEKKDQLETKLQAEVASMKAQTGELEGTIRTIEREKAELFKKVNGWTSIVKDFTKTNDQQGLLLKNTLEELSKLQVKQVKIEEELKNTTETLIEKMAVIESLETNKRRLTEEKSELQARLDTYLQPIGSTAVTSPVTQPKDDAVWIMPDSTGGYRDISLNAQILNVDAKNKMVSISIGRADGVEDGMRFHVTRGDSFLCDVVIIDVDTDKAVGVLEKINELPKISDTVSTNF